MKYRTYPEIGDAIKYGRQDMDRIMREVIRTEGIHYNNSAMNAMGAE